MPRPATLDHLRSRKKPTSKVVEMVLDPDLADAYNEAQSKVATLEAQVKALPESSDRAIELVDELKEAEAALEVARQKLEDEEAVVTFTFRSMPPHEYDRLENENRATPDQRKEARKQGTQIPSFNMDTFPQLLISRCSVEPVLSVDEVESLLKDENWNSAEILTLFWACVEVNGTRRTVDLPKG